MTTATVADLKVIERLYEALSPEKKQALAEFPAIKARLAKGWLPNPGPQTAAYYCEADELLYGGEAGGGKALDIRTPLPTASGWTTMGEVRVGDVLFDENGQPCRVVATTPIMRRRPCFRVVFSDGAEIIADAQHQWVTLTYKERSGWLKLTPQWRARRRQSRASRAKETSQKPWVSKRVTALNKARQWGVKSPSLGAVRTTLDLRNSLLDGKRTNHSVAVAKSLRCEPASLPIDPYLLGAWLGDGSSYKAEITTADQELVSAVIAGGFSVNHYAKYGYGIRGGLKTHLSQLGLLGNKHIPPAYLRASEEQRLALLQGLMDTDGGCDKRGQCEFTSTRRVLADGTAELIRSLGIKVALQEGVATLNGRAIGPKYRLKFLSEKPVFRLPRKLIRQKRAGFRGTHDRRYIVAVEPVASVPVRCIEVDSPSHQYLAGREMIPTHNSDLLIGLALTQHQRSRILRRINQDAAELGDRFLELLGHDDGFTRHPPTWRGPDGKFIEFRGCEQEKDKQRYKGKARDFIGYDELADFLESQYVFINTWNRSTNPDQRCRIVGATNGPTTEDGKWIVRRWAAWLDKNHPNPAKDGELRWYLTGADGQELEVDGPGPHEVRGKMIRATSRTFIRSRLENNPDLADTDYGDRLESLPEELRRVYREGDFTVGFKDDAWQVIPSSWIEAAQQRWTERPPEGYAMTAMAVDVAPGGGDQRVIACRYGGYFPRLDVAREKDKDGRLTAAAVVKLRRDNCPVVVDLGGGWGGDAAIALKDNGITVVTYMGLSPSSGRTRDGKLRFFNQRAEDIWRLREALDPAQEGGSAIALPPDAELKSDLAAFRWEAVRIHDGMGIKVEPKEKMKERIGRSPDRGEAVIMCLAPGDQAVMRAVKRRAAPRVILAYANAKRRR